MSQVSWHICSFFFTVIKHCHVEYHLKPTALTGRNIDILPPQSKNQMLFGVKANN